MGQKVKDRVSGFVGIAVARVEFLNGCVRIAIQPKVSKDGKVVGSTYFDIEQLEVVEGAKAIKIRERPSGGDRSNVPDRQMPTR